MLMGARRGRRSSFGVGLDLFLPPSTRKGKEEKMDDTAILPCGKAPSFGSGGHHGTDRMGTVGLCPKAA